MYQKIMELLRITEATLMHEDCFVSEYHPDTNTIVLSSKLSHGTFKRIRDVFRPNYMYFTLAHEVGHAICNCFDLDGFDELFGVAEKDYDENAYFKVHARALIRIEEKGQKGFITPYATTHPEEDFCDCVAFYLTAPKKEWPRDRIVRKKMKFVKTVIEEILEEG